HHRRHHAHSVQRTSTLGRVRFRIAGFGSAYPSGSLTNDDLAGQLGVDTEWIESPSGAGAKGSKNTGRPVATTGLFVNDDAAPSQHRDRVCSIRRLSLIVVYYGIIVVLVPDLNPEFV